MDVLVVVVCVAAIIAVVLFGRMFLDFYNYRYSKSYDKTYRAPSRHRTDEPKHPR